MSTPLEGGPEPRVETGSLTFGNDWPGCFIRGDNAFAYAEALQVLLDKTRTALQTIEGHGDIESYTAVLTLEGLLKVLRDTRVGHPKTSQHVEQRVLPFKDCLP